MVLNTAASISFSQINSTAYFTNGNLGINTTNPSANLDVAGTINASGLSSLANVTATNVSASTLIATTRVSSGLLSATNVTATNVSAGILIGTTITGANMSLSGNLNIAGTLTTVNITSTNLVQTNVSTGTLYASGTSTLQNATATNVSTGTLTASTGITTGTITASTGITTGTITANYIRLDAGTALDFIGNIDAANLTQTYIAFGPAGTSNDSSYLRQLGGTNSYKMALDINDDGDEPGFCIRSVKSTDTPDTINERFTVQAGGNVGINNSSPTANLDVVGTVKVSGLSALANLTATNVSTGTLTASTSLISIGNSNTVGNIYTTGGNVGIGTTAPSALLDVRGNMNYTGTIVNTSGSFVTQLSGGAKGTYTVQLASDASFFRFYSDLDPTVQSNYPDGRSFDTLISPNSGNHKGYFRGKTATNEFIFKIISYAGFQGAGSAGGNGTYAQTYYNAVSLSGSTVTTQSFGGEVTITIYPINDILSGDILMSNGFVGIGTTSPAYTLDVAGTAKIGGTHSNIIQQYSTSSFPSGSCTKISGNSAASGTTLEIFSGHISVNDRYLLLAKRSTDDYFSIRMDGNVGVGTASPAYTLDVNGTAKIGGNNIYNKILTLYDSGVSDAPTGATNFYGFGINSGTLRYQVPSTSAHLFYTGSTGSMIIATSGNVGIATTSPAYTLSVGTTGYGIGSGVYIGDTVVSARWLIQHGNSNLNLLQNNGSGTYLQRGSFANSTGTYSAVSDMRIKKDIQPISSGLNEIANLNPVSYLMEDQTGDSKRNFGFIAQDIESVLPEVVNTPKTENDLYTLQYTSIIPVLTKAIQELTQRLEDLQQEFNNYKASHP